MKKRIIIISMPWAVISIPSIQISSLQAFLIQHGITADVGSLYVPFADMIGHDEYMTISGIGKASAGEAIFAVHLYPQMKKRATALIRRSTKDRYDYDRLFKQTGLFLDEMMRQIPFSDYEYVGFSVVFNQLFSSLSLAGKIKESLPDSKIVFGGDACRGAKGRSLMEVYPIIDYIVSSEGEYPLLHLMEGLSHENIHDLIYRDNGRVIVNTSSKEIACLDQLPIPDFTEYYKRVKKTKRLKKTRIFLNNLIIPVETNRGCWWSKCTFCSYNAQYRRYREKSAENIVREVKAQTRRYGLGTVVFVGNNINLKGTHKLFSALKPLNLHFFLEFNAQIRDYNLLRQSKAAGVVGLQFGLESLSKELLERKIKKGVRLIDNIQMLKWLKELNIQSAANLIAGYPNETIMEFREAISNIRYIYHLEPPHVANFELTYGSPIFNNPGSFNIKELYLSRNYTEFIPQAIARKLILNYYDTKQRVRLKHPQHVLRKAIQVWTNKFTDDSCYPLLYYELKGGLVIITDRRKKVVRNFRLDAIASRVYLFCHDASKLDDILKLCQPFPKKKIASMLKYMVKRHLMFNDDRYYIGLAIDWQKHKKYLLRDGIKNHRLARKKINVRELK